MESPRTYCVYGIDMNDLERAREELEKVFAIRFEPHESDFVGEYFLFKWTNREELKLQRNSYPDDSDPAEPEFNAKGLLLRVEGLIDGSPRFLDVDRKIRESRLQLKLLKKETI